MDPILPGKWPPLILFKKGPVSMGEHVSSPFEEGFLVGLGGYGDFCMCSWGSDPWAQHKPKRLKSITNMFVRRFRHVCFCQLACSCLYIICVLILIYLFKCCCNCILCIMLSIIGGNKDNNVIFLI